MVQTSGLSASSTLPTQNLFTQKRSTQKISTPQQLTQKMSAAALATALAMAKTVVEIEEKIMPVGLFQGSNSWLISGANTTSGKPLFANDPHITFSVLAVWYEAHIITPAYQVYGHHIGGIPFSIMAATPRYAYGLTMLENDDVDFYAEEFNPDNPMQVKYKNKWVDVKIRHEVMEGGSGRYDILGYQNFDLNPRIDGYYVQHDRAQRLNTLLNGGDSSTSQEVWDLAKIMDVQKDVIRGGVAQIKESMIELLGDVEGGVTSHDALQVLKEWGFEYELQSIGPVIYERLYYFLAENLFSDELESQYSIFTRTHMLSFALHEIIQNVDSPWWNDVTTDSVDTAQDIVRRSWRQALNSLETQFGADVDSWRWSDMHMMEHRHAFDEHYSDQARMHIEGQYRESLS